MPLSLLTACLPKQGSTTTSPPPTTNPHASTNNPPIPHQKTPLYTLPIELLVQISTYLSPPCKSSFTLTGRYIAHALGLATLSTYLSPPAPHLHTKIPLRLRFEILERAFAHHWYCAWCDIFHSYSPKTCGPRKFYQEEERGCGEWNSYLHGGGREGKAYVLAFHHVRLVIDRQVWGNEFGISSSELDFSEERDVKVGRKGSVKIKTSLRIEGRVVEGRLYLHCLWSASSISPSLFERTESERVERLVGCIPQIVGGHRSDGDGHTGLKMSVKRALEKKWYSRADLCSTCATDYLVETSVCLPEAMSATRENIATAPLSLKIESWRDLGDGRNPFDAAWRAHGEIGRTAPGSCGDVLRLTGFRRGQIRDVFERGYEKRFDSGVGKYGEE